MNKIKQTDNERFFRKKQEFKIKKGIELKKEANHKKEMNFSSKINARWGGISICIIS